MKYKIADTVFELTPKYKYVVEQCKKYLYNGDEKPSLYIISTQQDIDNEKTFGGEFPDYYLESLSVFRKLCEYILNNSNGIIFHSSAVAVDNEAYLFTAPSGTGKSTHARLWRELLGDKVVMVNDDKPIIRYVDGDFYVYGTPWNGKHCLDTNTSVKIKAICEIKQDKDNSIEKLNPKDMLVTALNQTLRPKSVTAMNNLLDIIDKLLSKVELYRLKCNMDISAAKLSYGTMSGDKSYE